MIALANHFSSLAILIFVALPAALSGCNNVQGMPVSAPLTVISVSVGDSVLTTKIRTALMASGDMGNFDIRIQSQNDQVVLSGFADSQAQIDRNLALVKRVEGVGKIINHISIRRFT